MTTNTPQKLGRTADAHEHPKHLCTDCIALDLDREDLRGELAMLATIDLKRLAQFRVARTRCSWNHAWLHVMDAELLKLDLQSDDRAHRDVAMRAFETLTDYFNHRRLLAYAKPRPIILVHTEMAIGKRTRDRLAAIAKGANELEPVVHVH